MTHRSTVVDVHPHQLDYRLLVEESLAGIYLVQNDHFLYVNPALADLFGYSPTEIVRDRRVVDLVVPADRNRVLANLNRRIDGDVARLQYTFRALRRDGSTFDAEVRGQRTHAYGEPAVVGTLLDVTSRTQERDRLRFQARAAELLDSSLDYETTLESLTRLMIPFFADLCIIDVVDESGVRRLAAGPWPGKGDGFTLQTAGEPDSCDPSSEVALGNGTGVLMESVDPDVSRAIGKRLHADAEAENLKIQSLLSVPLIARGGRIGAMTLATVRSGRRYDAHDLDFAREVARCAALAVDNACLYREAQRAIQRRQEVLAVVSHDLRNPLNIIVMSASLGLEQHSNGDGPLQVIYNAAKEMERLINDLLDVSAIEAGGLSVDPKPHTLAPLIDRCVRMLETLATARCIDLRNEIPPDDSTVALVDDGRFVQAICNLLNNAIKFTPEEGSVRITLEAAGGVIRIGVHDSGPGIPPDELEHVFDRFWRIGPGAGGGTGLGLAIVRGIAEAHGGTAWAESRDGDGASFLVQLPRN